MVRKPLVVDEPVDRWFSRPLAHAVVFVAAPTPITANQLTALGSLFGVAAGVAAGMGEGALCAAGIVVFLIVDCADGQLARLRGVSGFLSLVG